ncbi:MAG: fumarate reductase subunit C [Woeseiaceae bacterium]|nr:fumarate reductase subunit C [Woeseiaceae bacterium]
MSARNTYVRPMSGWYRRNPHFLAYMLRELTAVFLAGYAGVLLAGVIALTRGPDAYAAFREFLSSPLSVGLHVLIFIAALYNAYTWFKVSPKAMPPIVLAGRRIPDRVIVGSQLVACVLVFVAMLLLAGMS